MVLSLSLLSYSDPLFTDPLISSNITVTEKCCRVKRWFSAFPYWVIYTEAQFPDPFICQCYNGWEMLLGSSNGSWPFSRIPVMATDTDTPQIKDTCLLGLTKHRYVRHLRQSVLPFLWFSVACACMRACVCCGEPSLLGCSCGPPSFR